MCCIATVDFVGAHFSYTIHVQSGFGLHFGIMVVAASDVSYGVRTHAHLRAEDLESSPLATRAN